jgi:hypothetical protein
VGSAIGRVSDSLLALRVANDVARGLPAAVASCVGVEKIEFASSSRDWGRERLGGEANVVVVAASASSAAAATAATRAGSAEVRSATDERRRISWFEAMSGKRRERIRCKEWQP